MSMAAVALAVVSCGDAGVHPDRTPSHPDPGRSSTVATAEKPAVCGIARAPRIPAARMAAGSWEKENEEDMRKMNER